MPMCMSSSSTGSGVHGDGVLGAEHGLDHAVSGSVQLTLLGHHGNAVAQDLLGENFILDLFQSNGPCPAGGC